MTRLREAFPEASLEVWAQDEARLGLKPTQSRGWAPIGRRRVARQRIRYEWLYLYGFVRPKTGAVFFLLLPTVNAAVFSISLRHFADHVGAGPDRRILLVLDGAGFHTAHDVVVPEGIHLLFQPPYSPELQPSEKLWIPVREHLHNRCFDTIDDLEDVIEERCLQIQKDTEDIRSRTLFHWWEAALAQ